MVDAESLTYLDDLLEEYLIFRGFTAAHKALATERKTDKLKGFQVQKIVAQLFSCVHNYNIVDLKDLWDHLNSSFFIRLEDELAQTVQKLELSLKRYYVVYCVQTGKQEKALEMFKVLAPELSTSRHWKHWFVLPYLKNPDQEPNFRVFFSKPWVETFSLSLHNFLSTIFRTMPLPRLLNFNVERNLRRAQEGNILALKQENESLRSSLHSARREIERLKSIWPTVTPVANVALVNQQVVAPVPTPALGNPAVGQAAAALAPSDPSTPSTPVRQSASSSSSQDGSMTPPSGSASPPPGSGASSSSQQQQQAQQQQAVQPTLQSSGDRISVSLPQSSTGVAGTGSAAAPQQTGGTQQPGAGPGGYQSLSTISERKKSTSEGLSFPALREGANTLKNFFTGGKKRKDDKRDDSVSSPVQNQRASIQPGGLVSDSPSPQRQTSESGLNRSKDDAGPKPVPLVISRSENFSVNGPITSCKFSPDGSYMAAGTSSGNVRIWPLSMSNAKNSATIIGTSEVLSLEWEIKTGRLLLCGTGDAKIKVWSIGGDKVIGDLQLPTGFNKVRKLACNPIDQSFACAAAPANDPRSGALFTWNLRTLQPVNKIDLGVTVNCFAYNHNGSMMVTGCADGTIRLLDMSNMTPILTWKAHNDAVLNVSFSTDETSIFTLGSDSQLLRWSVHSPGKIVKQYQYDGLPDKAQVADIAFEADGRYFIVPSRGNAAPIYHSDLPSPVQFAGQHSTSVTACDWHPIDPLCVISGSVDGTLCMTGMGYDLSEQT